MDKKTADARSPSQMQEPQQNVRTSPKKKKPWFIACCLSADAESDDESASTTQPGGTPARQSVVVVSADTDVIAVISTESKDSSDKKYRNAFVMIDLLPC
jgi:hypothetical protein